MAPAYYIICCHYCGIRNAGGSERYNWCFFMICDSIVCQVTDNIIKLSFMLLKVLHILSCHETCIIILFDYMANAGLPSREKHVFPQNIIASASRLCYVPVA